MILNLLFLLPVLVSAQLPTGLGPAFFQTINSQPPVATRSPSSSIPSVEAVLGVSIGGSAIPTATSLSSHSATLLSSATNLPTSVAVNGSIGLLQIVGFSAFDSLSLTQLIQCAGVNQSLSCASNVTNGCVTAQCSCAHASSLMSTCFGDKQLASCSNITSIRDQVLNDTISLCRSSGYAVDSSNPTPVNSASANNFLSASLFSAWTLFTAAVLYAI